MCVIVVSSVNAVKLKSYRQKSLILGVSNPWDKITIDLFKWVRRHWQWWLGKETPKIWKINETNLECLIIQILTQLHSDIYFKKKRKKENNLNPTFHPVWNVFSVSRSKCKKRSSKSQGNGFKVLVLVIISSIGSQSTASRSKWKGFHTVVEAIDRVKLYLINWKKVLATWQRANV